MNECTVACKDTLCTAIMQMINDFKQYYNICNQILLRRFTSVFMILKNNCSLCFKTYG